MNRKRVVLTSLSIFSAIYLFILVNFITNGALAESSMNWDVRSGAGGEFVLFLLAPLMLVWVIALRYLGK